MIRKLFAVGAIGAAGLVAAAGCTGAEAAGSIDLGTATATYTDLVADLYGTGQQNLADERRIHAAFQQSIADCMDRAGFDYPAVPFIAIGGQPVDIGDLASVAPIGHPDFGVAKLQESIARAKLTDTAFTRLSAGAKVAYGKALSACGPTAPLGGRWYPDGAHRLQKKLERIFHDIEARPAIDKKLADYRPCMQRAGQRGATWADVRDSVRHGFPKRDAAWSALAGTPAWEKAVSAEKTAAAADTACRIDLYNTVMMLGADEVQALVDDNADALASIRRQRAARDALPIPTVGARR